MAGELFEGFSARELPGRTGPLFARIGGDGLPVVLLHGFPQSHLMWHAVAPALARDFRVVALDLPGYGRSFVPADDDHHAGFSKRAMGGEVVAAMAALGHDRFHVVGHDRGARVAYRMALDRPEAVDRLAVLDIVPTGTLWRTFSVTRAMAFYHWLFLAQPAPLPETLIGKDPAGFLDLTMARWTRASDLSAFHSDALAAYRATFGEPLRLHAMCEDYRAGAGIDRAHDEASMDAGETMCAPTLVLWGDTGFAGQGADQLTVWRGWCRTVTGAPVASGHFIPEENPAGVLAALVPFLKGA